LSKLVGLIKIYQYIIQLHELKLNNFF